MLTHSAAAVFDSDTFTELLPVFGFFPVVTAPHRSRLGQDSQHLSVNLAVIIPLLNEQEEGA